MPLEYVPVRSFDLKQRRSGICTHNAPRDERKTASTFFFVERTEEEDRLLLLRRFSMQISICSTYLTKCGVELKPLTLALGAALSCVFNVTFYGCHMQCSCARLRGICIISAVRVRPSTRFETTCKFRAGGRLQAIKA